MLDKEGYRANVGIILTNQRGQLFWAKRYHQEAWQFPQGGIQSDETPQQALFRELKEEIGLLPEHVCLLTETRYWLRYQLPSKLRKQRGDKAFVGQKQKWFFLRLVADESMIKLDNQNTPEFDAWQWVSYWYPLRYVIRFKRHVYRTVLQEFLNA